MNWSERVCIAWSMTAIAFSFGCVTRGRADGQAEAIIHVLCIGFHVILIVVYIGMISWRKSQDEADS